MRRKTTPELPYYAVTLRRLREERGLTTLELSKGAGVAHETVRYLEAGTRVPGYSVLCRLAGYFKISPGVFFAPQVFAE